MGSNPHKGADVVPIGGSVRLVSVYSLAWELGLTETQARNVLKALQVPLLQIQQGADYTLYFNLPSLEAVLYLLLRPGRRYASPYCRSLPSHLVEILKNKADPIFAEMRGVSAYYRELEYHKIKERVAEAARQISKEIEDACDGSGQV